VNEQALRFILLATIAAIALFLFCLGTQDRWAQGFLALVIFVALYVMRCSISFSRNFFSMKASKRVHHRHPIARPLVG